ncbi:hypothetical protein E2C01_086607 [Portunus trituberculatus]|uniref:Uncharacterized protein n=1 Tax=Portunus trituberculatus TaxID=210409 RepID=A0A5B7J5V4_PORTR|nr:hypothetical protein [Portunus trituberculatus]
MEGPRCLIQRPPKHLVSLVAQKIMNLNGFASSLSFSLTINIVTIDPAVVEEASASDTDGRPSTMANMSAVPAWKKNGK